MYNNIRGGDPGNDMIMKLSIFPTMERLLDTTFNIHTTDGLKLHVHHWQPDGEASEIVLLIHGHGEHGGRYERLADTFNRHSIELYVPDLRGHGRSDGKRGHLPHYTDLMNDISTMISSISDRHPGVPLFLYGHSMGGNLVLNHILRRPAAVTGVIITSPLLRLIDEPPRWKHVAARMMMKIWPSLPMKSGISSAGLSRDQAIVDAYDADPLVHDLVTPRFLEVNDAGKWVIEHAGNLRLPILLMHGDCDRITSHEASIEIAGKMGENCTISVWKGLFHELHNEPEREQVLSTILDWLTKTSRITK
jgi:alpha-beta hydrolase superfamily lysophospholipase